MDRNQNRRFPNRGRNPHWRNKPVNSDQGDSRPPNRRHRENPQDDSENKNYRRDPRGPRKMGFKALQSFLEIEDTEQLIVKLQDGKQGFPTLLDEDMKPDLIVLVVRILDKVFQVPNSKAILKLVSSSKFFKNLMKYVLEIELQDGKEKRFNEVFWKETDRFWSELLSMCKNLFQIAPNLTSDTVHKLLKAVKKSIPRIQEEHSVSVSDELLAILESLFEAIDNIKKAKDQNEAKANIPSTGEYVAKYVAPTDDYHDISIYPNCNEITMRDRGFYLNENRIHGKYNSVHEYLDVQFRLLREDFVAPLRNAVCDYIENVKGKNTAVRYYKNVKFLNLECVNGNHCFKLMFDANASKKKRITYENSKRFMFGSLLCFTDDNFHTAFFGKVAERSIDDLKNGLLVVSLDLDWDRIVFNKPYLMMECSIYFEPYYQVLNVLQNMNVDNFPMERYIVNVETDTRPPEYILKLVPVLYTVENHRFHPLNFPMHNRFYGLNESQLKAFKAALTKDLAIIQGPPGTGKTFVALKIAQTLLENKSAWHRQSPILLICYTNHALDQFLEGMLQYTDSLVRIGGQSKNEALQDYNIRKLKDRNSSPACRQKFGILKKLVKNLKEINQNLNEITQYNSVISFRGLHDFMVDHPGFEWFKRADNNQLIEWLLAGKKFTQEYKSNPKLVQPPELSAPLAEEADEIVEDTNEWKLDEVIDLSTNITKECASLIDLSNVRKAMEQKQRRLTTLRSVEYYELSAEEFQELMYLENEIYEIESDYNYLRYVLDQAKGGNHSEYPNDAYMYKNPMEMLPSLRWKLYFYWVNKFKELLLKQKEKLSEVYRSIYDDYEELKNIDDIQVIRERLVIGLTTTMAARMNSVLKAVRCPIVIVEEAAEVLEAHIISALTVHCQHLILIGDHQQLKPSTADYSLETKFKLGISLFERMVRNNIECHTLNVQHRMKPEISSLICPAIYPNLMDHESVKDRDEIVGIDKSLYFIDHRVPEKQDADDTSKKNLHEAEFLMALAKHLLLNGYEDSQITILAAYLGQMYEMMRVKMKYGLSKVRIAVLDNYQGEESDIILLSLVRNNDNNSIGFLKLENRVCVAMSRARNGFYIMGNMDLLCNNSDIWPKIRTTLVKQDAIGESLTLRCQIHPHKCTQVKFAEDFDKVIEGGCDLICGFDMVCGHACKSLCHILDRDHIKIQCVETCNKLLCDTNPDHICLKACYQECGPCLYKVQRQLDCGHDVYLECHIDPLLHKCTELVNTELPCGHFANKPCFLDIERFRCPHPCETRVEPCGHACNRTCHVNSDPDHLEYKCPERCIKFGLGCTNEGNEVHRCKKKCHEECEPCLIQVKKHRTKCVHMYTVACSLDVDSIECRKPCKKLLACGHPCKSKCDEPCSVCKLKVEKVVPDCQHKIKIECCEEADRIFCKQQCPRILPCGHKCHKKCCEPCTAQCKIRVDCDIPSMCGHTITKLPCWLRTDALEGRHQSDDLLRYCNEPCKTTLKCEHKCVGSCGACHQGRIHAKCAEQCKSALICNHDCPIPCNKTCKPCQKSCTFSCKHSKCTKKCGQACTPCAQRCIRTCEHQSCKKKCGEPCDVAPCEEPCPKILKCNHPCVGFCSEPCPPLCRICDNEELTTILFGFEDDDDARFVLLEDCGHVIESRGLDRWFETKNDDTDSNKSKEISLKGCPLCKTNIIKTARYSDYIKQTMRDLYQIKNRTSGVQADNEKLANQLYQRIMVKNITAVDLLRPLATVLMNNLKPPKRRLNLTVIELDAIRAKIDILEHLCDSFKICKSTNTETQIKMILKVLVKDDDRISEQERGDIHLELIRLKRMAQFDKIVSYLRSDYLVESNTVKRQIFSLYPYSEKLDKDVAKVLEELDKKAATGLRISESERLEIVQAMGMTKGHWFKCPNGHIYCITECGGAMQEANCPECGAMIGGTNHQLTRDNSLAPEMDGARHAAWSDTANMANYGF